MPNIIHIFGQHVPHDTAIIVGNREGLTLLRDLLTDILSRRGPGKAKLAVAEAEVCDGEHFELQVHFVKHAINEELLPYTASWCQESQKESTKKRFYDRVIACTRKFLSKGETRDSDGYFS